MPLNKERVQLLVDALRSGEYEQGKRQLRSGDKFCCLGVACDIYSKQTKRFSWKEGHYASRAAALPKSVIRWYGFDSADPLIVVDQEKHRASRHNDTGKTFKQIATGFEALIKEAEQNAKE